ncbi:hypothetical protein GGR58DRAFT_497292 [Xylaria digitata]|nr:hypothetical protein GGR58DRAFT_497292 [Xylaria digitata]
MAEPNNDLSQTRQSPSAIKQEDHSESDLENGLGNQDGGYRSDQSIELVGVFPNLQSAMASEEADVLGRHQSTAAQILEELAQKLSANAKCIDIERMSSIKSLKKRASTPRTVIGVVGATGHGKSSLINVLLEDKLVPTDCLRACTAVVTEISWNSEDDPDRQYIAEVEFVSVQDWGRELRYLFHDLAASSGEASSEGQLEESDAAIAWAKIKAVYPKVTRQTIGQTNPKVLADDPAVKTLLGTKKTVRKRTAHELYEAIQIYVDSKKNFKTLSSDGEGIRKMKLWPLIKVVRIYTKADALSTGAVIVDLPGVQDSNAARAAVAAKYVEKCDGLWLVSMITRAVDDKTAKELLGKQFKQQLQLDGNYSNVTFVCSKTDDIDVNEAAEGLGLSDELQKLSNAKHKLSTSEASLDVRRLNERKEAISEYVEEIDKHISRYEKLGSHQAKGNTVTPPKENPRKRKLGRHTTRSQKRLRVTLDDESQDTQWLSTEDHWGDLEKGMPKYSEEHHLTQEDIQLMTEYLRSRKEIALDERDSLRGKIENNEDGLECLEEEVSTLEEQLGVACVSRRNDLSRQTIRDQFVQGLKELDKYEAERIDPNNFDPGKGIRDYGLVWRSLPVFCISGRAYKSLAKQERVIGFSNVNDTEVPQLRAHMKKLTETTRIRNAKSFLNDLVQILNSLYLWSSRKDIELYLTDEDKRIEMEYVRKQVDELEKRLQLANEEFSRQLYEILEALYRRVKAAVFHAGKCALAIARSWPTRKRGDGGLPFVTYRATVRRNGVFSGARGPRNFNEELAAPLLQQFSSHWETAFSKTIPEALDAHAKTCQAHQEYIQGLIKSRLQERVALKGTIGMLQDQDKARVSGLANKVRSFDRDITTSQREANREFAPAIQQKLKGVYHRCAMDEGPGVFARIKLEVETEIEKHHRAIFKGSYESAFMKLCEVPENIQEELRAYIRIMRYGMISDYSHVILGVDSSEESRIVRQEVFKLLEEVDDRFI